MNKLPVIVFTILAFQYNVQAMEDTRKSQPTYTHTVDLHNQSNAITCFPEFSNNISDNQSDFYTQDQATQKKQLQANLGIINQYESFYSFQNRDLKKLHEYITELHTTLDQLPEMQSFDELVNNKDIFPILISMSKTLPAINLLLLSQEYFSSSNNLSFVAQQAIVQQLSLYNPAYQNPTNLALAYDYIWNINKSVITNSIYNMLKNQTDLLEIKVKNMMAPELHIQHQKKQYTNALALMNQDNQATTQPVQTMQEITKAIECMQAVEETTVPLIQDQAQATIKKKSAKKSVPQAPVLSAKQQAALVVAEKKAEQSKRDKERRHMEQEDKLSAAVAKFIASSKMNPIKSKNSAQKKLNPQHSFKPIIFDEEDALLQAAIEENKKAEDAKALEQAIKLHELLAAQGTAIEKSVENKHPMIKQNQELIDYLEFIEARNKKYCQLQAAKEIETHNEYEKLKKLPYKDRPAAQRKIDTNLSKKYSMLSEEEQQILNLLLVYAEKVLDKQAIDNTPLEDIEVIVEKIVKAEFHLAQQGLHLKWYLAAFPDLYKRMKEQYIKFQSIVHNTIIFEKEAMKAFNIQDPKLHDNFMEMFSESEKSPVYKQKKISKLLTEIHTNNGILDISKLLYPIITREELDALGSLQPVTLHAAEEDIQFLFRNKTTKHDYTKIEPIVKNLLRQAQIDNYSITNMIREIIDETAKIADLESQDEKQKTLEKMNLKIFNKLQMSNELCIIALTDSEIADIAKVQVTAMRALLPFIKV